MDYKKITAIIQPSKLEAVEEKLKQLGVPGISVTKVKGYGESPNFFNSDWSSDHARIEIYIDEIKAQEVVNDIMNVTNTGNEGDGIVAILPVDSLYQIRTKNSSKVIDLISKSLERIGRIYG